MRILIAEDDPKLLKSLVHIFELNHYAVDGVGLSMAKAIAEKHKGEIAVYRKDGAHIGFKVTL